MGVTRLTGTLTCTSEAQATVVRDLLPEHIRLSRAEPGCLKFEITQGDTPLIWLLDEAFVDAKAFAAHQSRTKASIWAEKTADIARIFKRVDG